MTNLTQATAKPTFTISKKHRTSKTVEWVVAGTLGDLHAPFWYRASSRARCIRYIQDLYPNATITG